MEKTDSEFCTQEQQEAKEIRFEPMTLELTKEATAEQGNVTHAQTKGRAAQCNQDHGMKQTSARGNRFVTVIQYALDMVLAIREMARVARPEARLILVLGRESTVRHVPFFNGKLVSELAVRRIGLENERRQERQFVNHYGNKIHEDILHFRTSSNIPDKGFCLAAARAIAGQILSATRWLTATDTRQGIDDALERIELVSPSPLPSDGEPTNARERSNPKPGGKAKPRPPVIA